MVQLALLTSAVIIAASAALIYFPGPIAFVLEAIAIGMMIVKFRKNPLEHRRRMVREFRLELVFGAFVCGGLFSMAALGNVLADQLRRPLGLFWCGAAFILLGVLAVRIIRTIVMAVNRS